MEVKKYFEENKEINDLILLYLNDADDDLNYQKLLSALNSKNYQQNCEEFHVLLLLIINIANNHCRFHNFFDKIFRILNYLENDIKNCFKSQSDIFNFFKRNKLILLHFIQRQMITIDDIIGNLKDNKNLTNYFQPEIDTNFFNDPKSLKEFKENRQNGENESYITSLIRNDSVEEFISYVNKINISFESTIKPSIFETNSFLIDKKPTLIEYAAFFGSIQIFNYLKIHEVELKPSLWIYAIHSNNAEIISILESNNIELNQVDCFNEAIKCHHNNIAYYFKENYLSDSNEFDPKFCFIFSNFVFLSDYISHYKDDFIFDFCKYNYINALKILLEEKRIDINIRKVSYKFIVFYRVFKNQLLNKIQNKFDKWNSIFKYFNNIFNKIKKIEFNFF